MLQRSCCPGLCLVPSGQGCSWNLCILQTVTIAGGKSSTFLFMLEIPAQQAPVLPCSQCRSLTSSSLGGGEWSWPIQGAVNAPELLTSTAALGSWPSVPTYPETPVSYP